MSDIWTCPECGKEYDKTEQRSAMHQHKYQRHNLNTENYLERYHRVKSEIPEKYSEVYEELTGQGKAPSTFQAAVCYIESECTQLDAAEAFNVSELTIRRMVENIIDHGAVDLEYVQSNCTKTGDGMFGNRTTGNRKWKPEQ